MAVGEVKETKAQRAERLKRELNPWEAYDTIVRFAREGHASIPPEWATYFRWWGIYSQGDGVGAVGGVGGEGKATPYFMIRIRIPNGILASQQLRTVADLTERLESRKVVDRAKGLLQGSLGLSEPEAFRWIQKTAMDLRKSMREVAEGVIEHGSVAKGK